MISLDTGSGRLDPARQAASYRDPSLPIDPVFVATVQAFLLDAIQARSKIAAMP